MTFVQIAFAALLGCAASVAVAAETLPQPAPLPPAIAAPRDVPYPGQITLDVDATDVDRRIFSVRQSIPVAPGPAVLLFPEWLPGNHAPRGRVDKLAGLTISAAGKALDWRRDTVNMFAFHVDVPAGATTLDVAFQYLTPTDGNQGRVVMTPEMLNLQWNMVVLYPAGHFTRRITVDAAVTLPAGWAYATALETKSRNGDRVTFKPTTIETLVDSPMFAGRHAAVHELGKIGEAPVRLNLFADEPGSLAATDEQLAAHRSMVTEAAKLFGSRHFQRYDFLLALTDRLGGIGLEHHASSENSGEPGYFTDWAKTAPGRDLLPHEFTHSWNGKFRRPAELWTANYNVPMRTGLLWVYEGQTQYWGEVLAARSGLLTKDQALQSLAATAALYEARIGRAWKPLQDTTNDTISAARQPQPWRSWQRSEDYYSEGLLVWLDVDTLIRERTGGRRSLDDFAKRFFGTGDGTQAPMTYTFEDIVAALDSVAANDWATFLKARLDGRGPGAPLDGITRGGYKLTFADKPTEFFKAEDTSRRTETLSYSLGLTIGREARLVDIVWQGPAYRAGLTVGTQLIAVNGIAYDADRLKAAITDAKLAGAGGAPIELLVKKGDHYRTVAIDYRDGLRYPRLERTGKGPASLDQILSPKK